MIKLNPQFIEVYDKQLSIKGVLAYIDWDLHEVHYWDKWYIKPFMYFIKKHERVHSWGIKNCLSNSSFCIMKEDDDTWLGKLKTIPLQILGLGRTCVKCSDYLRDKGVY